MRMSAEAKRVKVARTYAEMQQLIADTNREMAEKLRAEAQRVEQSDEFNHLYVGNGDPRRVLLTSSNFAVDTTGSCLLALIEVDEALKDLEHGTITIKIQDGLPVLVEITTKHKPRASQEV